MRAYTSIEWKTRRTSGITIFFAFLITGFLLAVVQSPRAATPVSISIDFVGDGTSMDAAEVAGVVPKANWNSASGATSSTPLALKDETGASSTSTVTWTADNTWSTPIADDPWQPAADERIPRQRTRGSHDCNHRRTARR
jgi:hypothetical protein